jgi:hypothetical protein
LDLICYNLSWAKRRGTQRGPIKWIHEPQSLRWQSGAEQDLTSGARFDELVVSEYKRTMASQSVISELAI